MRVTVDQPIIGLLLSSILVCAGCAKGVDVDESATGNIDQGDPSTNLTDSDNPQQAAANSAIEFAAQILVAQTQSATGLEVDASARFYETTTPLLNPPTLRAKQTPDLCEITGLGDQFTIELMDFPIDHLIEAGGSEILQVSRIAAGETIELQSDAGSFASLHSDLNSAEARYSIPPAVELNTVPPQEMILDVPGAQFPLSQFNWVKPEGLSQEIKTLISELPANPVLVWEGRNSALNRTFDTTLEQESRVLFWAGQINEITGSFTSYQCNVQDDGSFTIPANIQQLYTDGFDATFISAARYTRRVQVVDDIVLVSVYLEKF